ncbi:MAG TPA: hypothetical protein DEQ80_02945 [Anaerolinea thermolimosa]|uniref:Uncharacterized protein n=1 Tax=Anaerolinea thermolimosa TaxID=229919 RepID=A0A3D1JED7_9CHLR|nr:hypothetical protein [Anaerolinea thermolimosa]
MIPALTPQPEAYLKGNLSPYSHAETRLPASAEPGYNQIKRVWSKILAVVNDLWYNLTAL